MQTSFHGWATALLVIALISCSASGGPVDPPILPGDPPPPVLTSVSPAHTNVVLTTGQSVTFEVVAESPAGSPLHYVYRLDGVITSTAASYRFAPNDTGRYRIEASVSDGDRTTTRVWTVAVSLPPNAEPTAVLAIDPAIGSAPLAVRVRLTGVDVDGNLVRYRVDITGTTQLAIERTASIDTFLTLEAGSYNLIGTIEDNRGAKATATGSVRVEAPVGPPNSAPTISLTTSETSGEAPLSVAARALAEDVDGTVSSLSIDFDGDGRYDAGAPRGDLDASFTYLSEGTFVVRAVATDDKGATGVASATIVVRRPNARPTGALTASATTGEASLAVTLSSTGSDTDGTIVKWEIDADDGNEFVDVPAFGSRSVVYPFRASVYRPQLRLTDDRGGWTIVDGPQVTVYRPISPSRSSTRAPGNPHFANLSIAPAIWADGSDRFRITVIVRDQDGEPVPDVPIRVTSLRPDLIVQNGIDLGGTVAIALDGTTTDAEGRLEGEVTVSASGRAYEVPQLGVFQSFALKVEANAGHGVWRRLPDIAGLNAETIVSGNEGVGQFYVLPAGLVCVNTPVEIHVRAVRRSDAPGAGGPANGLPAEIRYSLGGAPLPGLRPAPGYESWRTDANGRIAFRFTPTSSDLRTIKGWVDGQPLNITIGLAVQNC
jgi:PKD repeat protein